ncbi:MAG: hypothetical protein J5645_03930 [Lachnospiraceae bacterium]|nr:hypothetical protein [Lachnospiraceae bacterium]
MKRLQRILLAIVSLTLVAVLSACTMYNVDVAEGGAHGIANEERKDAFLQEFVWDGNEDNMRIDVREIDGVKVTRYGGFSGRGFPCPFCVSIEGLELLQETEIQPGVEERDLYFTLVINDQIRDFNLSYNYDGYDFGCYYKDTKERIFYHIHLIPELDPNNKYFYKSESDGKIYKKDTNEPVTGLWYPEEHEQEQAQEQAQ